MSLVLRVDVDKPYGNSTLLRKIASKFIEDYIGKAFVKSPGYLSHQIDFLQYCNSVNVPGFFYYRTCTAPSATVNKLMAEGKHKTGFHAENTRTFETFSAELTKFRQAVAPIPVESFSKHGSGVHKLGKNHYPAFEPEKYLEWAKKLNCAYISGNDICEKEEDLFAENGYHDRIFWVEPDYRNPAFNTIEQLITAAKKERVVVLIHPENYNRVQSIKDDFKLLVKRAKEENISWEVF